MAALATALVYGLGGTLAFNGSLSPGDVVALALLLSRLYGPLTALSNVRVDVMSAMVSFDRVFEVLDLPPMIREAPDAVPIPADDRSIEFDSVSFSYPAASDVSLPSLEEVSLPEHGGPTPVLHDVSFRVEPGQLVALVGHSGAGKSTIANLVPRLYDVTDGAIRVGGVDVRAATLDSLRDTIGVVSQDAHLFHDTIRANLLYARPEATEESCGTRSPGRDRGADRVAARRAGHRGGRPRLPALRRREAAAGDRPACCSRRPAVVILDEATAHLDSESEVAVQHALDSRAGGPDLAGHRPPAVDHPRAPTRSSSSTAVASWSRALTRSCWRSGSGTPSSTGPSSPTASVERSAPPDHYRPSCPISAPRGNT